MINLGIMVCFTKVREKVVFNFTLKWFHVIIILLRIIDSLEPFLIERCKEWGDLLKLSIPNRHFLLPLVFVLRCDAGL